MIENIYTIKTYWKKNQTMAFFLILFTLLCRGSMFLGSSLGIDTEVMLALKDVFYDSWYGIGRFGLVLIKKLTDTMTYNPYFTGIAVIVLLPVVCLLWTGLFEHITRIHNKVGIFFYSLTLIASTILTEQLYFKLQALEICVGFCMVPLALFLLYEAATKKMSKWKKAVFVAGALALAVILFGIYQVMVPLFIFGAASICYLYVYFGEGQDEEAKKQWSFAVVFIGAFFAAFAINRAIVAIFFSQGDSYLAQQIAWGTDGVAVCFSNIWQHIKEVVFGSQIYYAKTYSVYVLGMLILTVYLTKHRKKSVLGILSVLLIIMAPFYMTILCGTAPVIRSQLVYPFVLSFMIYTCFLQLGKKKVWTYILLFLGAFTVFLQVKYTAMLNYSDTVRYEQDVQTANRLIAEIDALQNEDQSYPVVFYGAYPAKLNNSCIRGDVIGYSFFEWDTEEEPTGFFSTRRILSFMHALGTNYAQADEETTKAAVSYLTDMPGWPAKGSVALQKDVIVVKLGEIQK